MDEYEGFWINEFGSGIAGKWDGGGYGDGESDGRGWVAGTGIGDGGDGGDGGDVDGEGYEGNGCDGGFEILWVDGNGDSDPVEEYREG